MNVIDYNYSKAEFRLSIKDVRTKSRKIDHPPPCPCGHPINFEKPEVLCTKTCEPPLSTKCPHWTTPFTADVLYGRIIDKNVIGASHYDNPCLVSIIQTN